MENSTTKQDRNLWILAHPDDEIFALHILKNFSDATDCVVYLTNGVPEGATFLKEVRQKEAEESWNLISNSYSISFFGGDHIITDGYLGGDFNKSHFQVLLNLVKAFDPNRIITLKFEGGHQDHDVTSLIACSLAAKLNLRIIFFPAYRATVTRLSLYAVMSSGSFGAKRNLIGFQGRVMIALNSLRLMKKYGSQRLTWLGLAPFVFTKYLFGGLHVNEQIQAASKPLIMPAKFLYVNRKKAVLTDYAQIMKNLENWMK